MAGYKLATYQSADGPRAGLVVDDKVFDAAKLTGKAGLRHRARHHRRTGNPPQGALKKAAAGAAKSQPRASRSARPSCSRRCWPSAIYCAGANYADHCRRDGAAQQPAGARSAHPGAQGLALHQGVARDRRHPGATVKISDVFRSRWTGRSNSPP